MALNPFEQLQNVVSEPRQAFEDSVCKLLQATKVPGRRVRLNPGDGGVDLYVGNFGSRGSVDVYQIKYFPNPWEETQKKQIRKSYDTAKSSADYNLASWTLCVPVRLTKDDIRWFDTWRKGKGGIEVMDGDELTELLRLPSANQVIQQLVDWGVQGLRPPGPSFEVRIETFRADPKMGFTFHLLLSLANRGERTASDVRVKVDHSETGCRAGAHDNGTWEEADKSGRLNPRHLRSRHDLHRGEVVRIMEILTCERTAWPISLSLSVSSRDQEPTTLSGLITIDQAEKGEASVI